MKPSSQPRQIGVDLGSDDKTSLTMFVQHPGHPGCGFTVIVDGQITLHRLGLMPLRCKSCHELMPREGA